MRPELAMGVTMGRLDGHRGVITGAASGIGEATARLFIREGAALVLADIDDERGKRIADECGDRARFVHVDVSEEGDIDAAVAVATANSAAWTACSTTPATRDRSAPSRRSTWPCSIARWLSICGVSSSASGLPPG